MSHIIPSAIPSPLRASFPDRPLSPVPDPYDGALDPDDCFYARNACDVCERGLEVSYDMVVAQDTHGTVWTYCPRCFVAKYARTWHPLVRWPFEESGLVYVNVLQGGKFYRWEKQP